MDMTTKMVAKFSNYLWLDLILYTGTSFGSFGRRSFPEQLKIRPAEAPEREL